METTLAVIPTNWKYLLLSSSAGPMIHWMNSPEVRICLSKQTFLFRQLFFIGFHLNLCIGTVMMIVIIMKMMTMMMIMITSRRNPHICNILREDGNDYEDDDDDDAGYYEQ